MQIPCCLHNVLQSTRRQAYFVLFAAIIVAIREHKIHSRIKQTMIKISSRIKDFKISWIVFRLDGKRKGLYVDARGNTTKKWNNAREQFFQRIHKLNLKTYNCINSKCDLHCWITSEIIDGPVNEQ